MRVLCVYSCIIDSFKNTHDKLCVRPRVYELLLLYMSSIFFIIGATISSYVEERDSLQMYR